MFPTIYKLFLGKKRAPWMFIKPDTLDGPRFGIFPCYFHPPCVASKKTKQNKVNKNKNSFAD